MAKDKTGKLNAHRTGINDKVARLRRHGVENERAIRRNRQALRGLEAEQARYEATKAAATPLTEAEFLALQEAARPLAEAMNALNGGQQASRRLGFAMVLCAEVDAPGREVDGEGALHGHIVMETGFAEYVLQSLAEHESQRPGTLLSQVMAFIASAGAESARREMKPQA